MGAPKGNDFWKLRKDMSNDGRQISVEEFPIKCQEYIDRCAKEKILEIDYRGKDLEQVALPKMIAMTIWGLCHHLGISSSTWLEYKKDKKYSSICIRVEDLFKAYNIEGTSAGQLNHAIIARVEGLKDQQDITSNGKEVKNIISFGGQEIEI